MADPARIMVVLNVDLPREFSDLVTSSLVKSGAVPEDFDDLLAVREIVVDGQTRYIVEWA